MFGMKTLFAMLSAVTRDMAFGAAKTVRANRRPSGAELRDPKNPFQAARLQAAKDKRQRKAAAFIRQCISSSRANVAHQRATCDLTFNPFYVAK